MFCFCVILFINIYFSDTHCWFLRQLNKQNTNCVLNKTKHICISDFVLKCFVKFIISNVLLYTTIIDEDF